MKINSAKLVVDNHSTEEVVEYLTEAMKLNRSCSTDAVLNQNVAQMGVSLCNIQYIESILVALNEKLNGKKEKTVVQ